MFRMYGQYLQHITTIELYVDFEEMVAEVGRASLHHNKTIQSHIPYQVSHGSLLNFLFQTYLCK